MRLSSSRRNCFPNSPSGRDFQRTRCSVHTMICYLELASMQTMIADMHECYSKLVVCVVKGHCTKSSKKSYREWESRSNSIPRMEGNSLANSGTPSTVLRLQRQTNRHHGMRMKILAIARGATLKARLGILEKIFNRSRERGAILPRRLLKLDTRPTVTKMLCRKLIHHSSKRPYEQPTSKTRNRMAQNITLEPG
jgi:hypothetical protein